MEIVNGPICISHAELIGRIITKANLKALVRKDQVKQVKKGGNTRRIERQPELTEVQLYAESL